MKFPSGSVSTDGPVPSTSTTTWARPLPVRASTTWPVMRPGLSGWARTVAPAQQARAAIDARYLEIRIGSRVSAPRRSEL